MPDRRTHLPVGALSGAAAATLRARSLNSPTVLLEAVAGAVGGMIGGAAPDFLEPAVTPNHRALFHSMLVAGGLAMSTTRWWEDKCRTRCAYYERLAAAHSPGCPQRLEAERNATVWRCAAALLIGFAVGYASHLLLDGQTPRSIPVIGL